MNNRLKLLLIDDSTERRDAIINKFDETYNHAIDITIAKDANKAITIEEKHKFDLIILDLNLPYDDDGANNSGGRTFIDKSSGVKNKLIYLTSTEKTKQNNIDIIDEDYFVMSDDTGNKWLKTLIQIFEKRLKELNLENKIENKIYDIVILTALNEELDISMKAISNSWYILRVTNDSNIYYTTKICSKTDSSKKITIIASNAHKMGMSSSAVLATKMLINFKPKIITMLGICAGRDEKVKLGEIIVANKLFDYQAGKVELVEKKEGEIKIFDPKTNEFKHYTKKFKADYDERTMDNTYSQIFESIQKEYTHDIRESWNNLNKMSNESERNLPKVHIGPMATGSAVIAHDTVFEEISDHSRKVIALDMEGYSIFVAAQTINKHTIPLVIKGVQDHASHIKNDDYRNYSIYVAARFFYEVCVNKLIEEIIE